MNQSAREMIGRYLSANGPVSTEVGRVLTLFKQMPDAGLKQEHIEYFVNSMHLEFSRNFPEPVVPLDLSDALSELSRNGLLRCYRYKGTIFYELTTRHPTPGAVEVSMRPAPVRASPLYGLVEAASRTLAPTKPEMEALLATWHNLGAQQSKDDPEYLQQLQEALHTLDQSPDVPTFLHRLRGEPISPPAQGEADEAELPAQDVPKPSGTVNGLKTALIIIIFIPLMIGTCGRQ